MFRWWRQATCKADLNILVSTDGWTNRDVEREREREREREWEHKVDRDLRDTP